jgi:glycosyltransferase involved in cell wall biosynthesis
VLASDIAAHREVAGGLATLLDPADPDAWSEALTRLGETGPPEPADFADARRAHAAGFTWERSARAHLQAYRSSARTTGRRRAAS